MAIHKPYDRYFICPPNAKLSDIDSLLLQEGQIGIYDISENGEQTENGLKAITDFKGYRKDEQNFEIRVGRNNMVKSRISDDKPFSTPPFAIDEIIDCFASAPKSKEIEVDKVIFGYNGIDANTDIDAHKGDRIPVTLYLSGRPFELRGYPEGRVEISDYIIFDRCPATSSECAEFCDPCEDVDKLKPVLDFIERVKNQPIAGGAKVGDFVEIKPIHECDETANQPVEIPMNFYTLEMCDTGDGYAMAELQAAYPGLNIKRIDRHFMTSKYHVMKQGEKPADYEQKMSSIMKGCEDCPEGYTAVEGGLVYAVSLEDDGADQASVVETLANAVSGTALKSESQDKGTGMYTVVLEKKLSSADKKEFVEANPTAEITYVGKTADMCSNPTIKVASWKEAGSCMISKEAYMITMPDGECGVSALEELQNAYPMLEIEDYGTPSGCQHQFKTTVLTSMVCDECDPIFKDFYVSKAPEGYRNRNWVRLGAVAGDDTIIEDPLPKNCKVGVSFEGIDYLMAPLDDSLMDSIVLEEGSVRIAVTGGYPDEQREAVSTYFNPIHTEYVTRWAPRTHMGGSMLHFERQSRQFFDFNHTHRTHLERVFTNEETRLDFLSQYADFAVTFKPGRYSNGFGRVIEDRFTVHFLVPYGAHEGIQDMVNMLAASAGVKPCKV